MALSDVSGVLPRSEDQPSLPTEDVGTNTEPPLTAASAVAVPTKRGRGRPPKNPQDPRPPKRGPGRPRKRPEASPKDPNAPKRGRGRPRKNPTEPEKHLSSGDPAKSGRGRRKKTESNKADSTVAQPGEGESGATVQSVESTGAGKKKRGRPRAQEGEGPTSKKAKVREVTKKSRKRGKKTVTKDSDEGGEELRLTLSESPGSDAGAASKLKRNGVLQTKPADQPQQESSDSSYATP